MEDEVAFKSRRTIFPELSCDEGVLRTELSPAIPTVNEGERVSEEGNVIYM